MADFNTQHDEEEKKIDEQIEELKSITLKGKLKKKKNEKELCLQSENEWAAKLLKAVPFRLVLYLSSLLFYN